MMARKSRKLMEPATLDINNGAHIWKAALYTRLSVEDRRYKRASDSLQAQQYMLERYASDQTDMIIQGTYIDNGETGTRFDRPAFNRMIRDIKTDTINCILVKDLSRFGRNYIEAGTYLEEIFPALGVRFISVADMYDSHARDSNNATLAVALKNIIHDAYARDISVKIRSTLEAKQRRGEFIGTFPVYGYIKMPEDRNRLTEDPQTAETVKNIYRWKLNGASNVEIARQLNERDIPSPGRYLYETGVLRREDLKTMTWLPSTVARILRSRIYLGDMVQGKSKVSAMGEENHEIRSEKEWIIVESTHQPLIDKETFEAVQSLKIQRRP